MIPACSKKYPNPASRSDGRATGAKVRHRCRSINVLVTEE
jgi:hypothetical protein